MSLMNVQLYLTRAASLTTGMYRAMVGLMEHEKINFTVTVDGAKAMELAHGKLNPLGARLIARADDGTLLWNIYDLVEWIDKKGLRRI